MDMLTYEPNADIQNYLIEVDEDRYSGAYSGAGYTAWLGFRPDDIDAGDSTCEEFWENNRVVHGRGDSPQAAYLDLVSKHDPEDLKRYKIVSVNPSCQFPTFMLIGTTEFALWLVEGQIEQHLRKLEEHKRYAELHASDRDDLKSLELAYDGLKRQYADVAQALGFECCPTSEIPHASHADIMCRALALQAEHVAAQNRALARHFLNNDMDLKVDLSEIATGPGFATKDAFDARLDPEAPMEGDDQ
jgi:hypothetical protein